jgi:hypothetical protein
VPKFRVELERPAPREFFRNPFRAPMPSVGATIPMRVRSWEFEAKDEAEVRRLLQEAQDQDIDNVRGFRLRSITQIQDQQQERNNG